MFLNIALVEQLHNSEKLSSQQLDSKSHELDRL